ncbi:hypothetical protein QL285_065243 [Trifolium repens]|nr:hypothetical protein QL285_065243 [Trifolium repens]
MADWSKLPKELLQLISEKLNCEFHELRFRSVCSSWRSSSSSSIPKNHLLNLPSDIPNPIEPTTSNFSLSLSPNTPFSRSLCSSWRSSSSIPKTHLLSLPSKLPYPSESNNNTPTYPISKRTIFLINPPPNQQQTLNPWLIKIGLDSRGFTTLWNPLSRDNQLRLRFQLPHQFDFSELSLFKLGHEFVIGDFSSGYSRESRSTYNSIFMKKVVAYNTLHCSVLLTIHISGKLAIFRNDAEQWMVMPEMPPNPYTDVCVFNGRPIAVDRTGLTGVVGPDFSLDLVAEAVFGGGRKLLVESDGELLLVDKYSHRIGQFRHQEQSGAGQSDLCTFTKRVYKVGVERAVRFDVFRLDENDKKWVKLTNLGDRVLFLGKDCAFSAKASDLCMENGNCVIFRDDDYGGHIHSTGLGINVFCLDNQQISPLSALPRCSNLFWPPPQWTGLD